MRRCKGADYRLICLILTLSGKLVISRIQTRRQRLQVLRFWLLLHFLCDQGLMKTFNVISRGEVKMIWCYFGCKQKLIHFSTSAKPSAADDCSVSVIFKTSTKSPPQLHDTVSVSLTTRAAVWESVSRSSPFNQPTDTSRNSLWSVIMSHAHQLR